MQCKNVRDKKDRRRVVECPSGINVVVKVRVSNLECLGTLQLGHPQNTAVYIAALLDD